MPDDLEPCLKRFGIRRKQIALEQTDYSPPNAIGLTYEEFMDVLSKLRYIARAVSKNAQGTELRIVEGGPFLYENSWGSRANIEFPEEQLLEAVANVFDVQNGSEEYAKLISSIQKASRS
jgi:hypothetical protein